MAKLDYSVVIPVYNEEKILAKLNSEINKAMSKISKNYEIIYVNDKSSDNSLEELKKMKGVKIIDLNRNYGQSTALDAGFKEAEGDIIISMDGDGQNDPADIPRLIKDLKERNLDVVAGWRKNRADKHGIRILTRIGRLLRRTLIKDKVHDTGCTLRAYTKEAAKSLDIQGEMHRYILALLRWKGFRIGEIVVNDRRREHGVSKYGYSKAVKGFIDLLYIWFINKYYQRPLHLFGYLSILALFTGFVSFGWSAYRKIFAGDPLNRSGWFLLGIFFVLAGIMSFSFGIIIDLLIRIYLNTSPHDKRYYVREILVR